MGPDQISYSKFQPHIKMQLFEFAYILKPESAGSKGRSSRSLVNQVKGTLSEKKREYVGKIRKLWGWGGHNGRKSLILAPQEIPDISGYQWGFGCQFVRAHITENPVPNQKIL